MRLRWSIGLPGPFYLSGNVLPRLPHNRRRRRGRGGGVIGLLFVGIFWLLVGELLLAYWAYLGLIGLVWWGIASVVHKRVAPWPVPAHAWTFWRKRNPAATSEVVGRPRAGRVSPAASTRLVLGQSSAAGRPASVADELLKLQSLRRAGTITDAELLRLKNELLAR